MLVDKIKVDILQLSDAELHLLWKWLPHAFTLKKCGTGGDAPAEGFTRDRGATQLDDEEGHVNFGEVNMLPEEQDQGAGDDLWKQWKGVQDSSAFDKSHEHSLALATPEHLAQVEQTIKGLISPPLAENDERWPSLADFAETKRSESLKATMSRSANSGSQTSGSQDRCSKLDLLCGRWKDTFGSAYTVTLDDGRASLSVLTTRPSGQVLSSYALIYLERGRIVWGKSGKVSFCLADSLSDSESKPSQIRWVPPPNRKGKSFEWTRS